MEKIPLEILIKIISRSEISELLNLRLVHSQFLAAADWVIACSGLSTLNTSSGLKNLQQLLKSCNTIASFTNQLTIYHGEWPVCSREQWETHPLLFGGNDRWNTLQYPDSGRADEAFAHYKRFINEEEGRRFSGDVNTITNILGLLPTLRTIVISHIQGWSWHPSRSTKYHNLQKKIWISPYVDAGVTTAVQTFLALTNNFINVKCLKINGTLNPADLYLSPWHSQFPSIHKLCVKSFQILENQDAIQKFLQAFPNLVHLSVKFQGWESSIPSIVGDLFWPQLKTVRLDDLWASEDDIFGLFNRHRLTLEQFSLGDTTIIEGSWRSLFSRMRTRRRIHTQIVVDGELYGRRFRDTVTIHHHGAAARLDRFMQDQNAPWPFGAF